MSNSHEVITEPSLERRTRRQFSSAEKRRLLEEYDALPRGDKGGCLRQQGLYAAQLADWRKTLQEQGSQGLEPRTGGRKPKDARDRRIEELERERARLEKRLHIAEESVVLQKSSLRWSRTPRARTRDELPPPALGIDAVLAGL